jgi:hypothetical protein
VKTTFDACKKESYRYDLVDQFSTDFVDQFSVDKTTSCMQELLIRPRERFAWATCAFAITFIDNTKQLSLCAVHSLRRH